MKITDNKVVQFHYTLKDEAGEEIENSYESDPLAYLHGHKNMIVGVENALTGKEAGEKFSVTLQPADAYGERQEDAIERVPAKHLQGATKWKPGMTAVVNTEQGQRQVTVVKAGRFMVTVDINPPLAGKVLTFDLEVVDVRDATDEEVEHGHAHGVGGHHH
ncbi:FKBP-type peptidyl-prolyl cis-trans isomerase [Thalassotalea profundi]|uniref:Peptidyl-prolyl cis-trans isomerase n=1 Tax=Thalassotalea profundi TaxID=2036687 RepID=A0ABQ3J1P7_9GAMM|nr:peptidylprolyl isomerase [Thalassotalea profundi]GHF01304.1 peptidyl-prolyl cis-trans isomerase [Thalassotalea profundi]